AGAHGLGARGRGGLHGAGRAPATPAPTTRPKARARASRPAPAVQPPETLDPAAAPRPGVAAQSYGGYSYENVKALEGRYVCLRPGFASPGVISAYLMDLR